MCAMLRPYSYPCKENNFITHMQIAFAIMHTQPHSHDHAHSHEHGEDCDDTCGPKVTSADDVKDVEMPEWKKKALAAGKTDAGAAPFGMSWNTEETISATDASKKVEGSHDHGGHDHGHS